MTRAPAGPAASNTESGPSDTQAGESHFTDDPADRPRMISANQFRLYGAALLDYFKGDRAATISIHDALGKIRDFPLSEVFRDPPGFFELERMAVELCRGRVLDIGSGNGRHSLALQERGLEVVAIDILPECVEVTRARGVREVYRADVLDFSAPPFDTLLSMVNGLSMVERLEALSPYLSRVRRLVKPGGQYLIHSTDVRRVPALRERVERNLRDPARAYFGEMDCRLEYKGERGEAFTELYVDPEALAAHARAAGWACDIVAEREQGFFLARLTPAGG